jgi:riboflavin transporter FmnP
MWLFIVFYGIFFGLIAGASFMVAIVECNKYFPGKKMYVNGFILVGTGLGSVVFGLFSYNYLNPNHVAPVNGYYEGSPELRAVI